MSSDEPKKLEIQKKTWFDHNLEVGQAYYVTVHFPDGSYLSFRDALVIIEIVDEKYGDLYFSSLRLKVLPEYCEFTRV